MPGEAGFDFEANDYSFTTSRAEHAEAKAFVSVAGPIAPCPDHSGAETVVTLPASRDPGRNEVRLDRSNREYSPHLEIQTAP